ncbi:hypothetical protein NDU88_002757 [Pleurodeles waltl]|uniref:Secreted protein n=1 Tax=Pleurodeles waltl TaxID=8319 RepID=A0AAV7QDU4_PLEWA|nr:hypothetical protein NDU88_002757 [Pleurodeles waltl]
MCTRIVLPFTVLSATRPLLQGFPVGTLPFCLERVSLVLPFTPRRFEPLLPQLPTFCAASEEWLARSPKCFSQVFPFYRFARSAQSGFVYRLPRPSSFWCVATPLPSPIHAQRRGLL